MLGWHTCRRRHHWAHRATVLHRIECVLQSGGKCALTTAPSWFPTCFRTCFAASTLLRWRRTGKRKRLPGGEYNLQAAAGELRRIMDSNNNVEAGLGTGGEVKPKETRSGMLSRHTYVTVPANCSFASLMFFWLTLNVTAGLGCES